MCACVCVQFVKDAVHIVDGQDAVKPPELRTRSRGLEEHQVWCEKTWNHVLPTLEYWALELHQLKVYFITFANYCYCCTILLYYCRFI